jgi:cardiolipin synthase
MHHFTPLSVLAFIVSTWFVVEWIIRIIAVFIVPKNRKPSSGTAWLIVIFLSPTLGIIAYFVLGSPKLPASRRLAQKTLDHFISETLAMFKRDRDSSKLLSAVPPAKYQSLAKLSESLSRLPVFGGNDIEILPEYNEVIDRIITDIDAAKHSVQLEYFIIALDTTTEPLFDALARAVKRGIIVRVMYDALSVRKFPNLKKMKQRFTADGVLFQPMLPLKFPGKGYMRPDLRNHRKLVIIDGRIGYTGSQNLVQRDYHRKDEIYYDELVVRVQGPIVMQLAALFLTDWFSETGVLLDYEAANIIPASISASGHSLAQVLPSGPGYEDENNLKLFTSLIHLAEHKIVITNPYFVPEESLITAITSAAKRGVDVTMINSEVIDQWMVGHAQRSFYEILLHAGVKIYWYKAPILLHSKFITVDDDVATIGSSNLDIRSFELDLEVTLISYDRKTVEELRNIEASYLRKSKQVTLAQWQKRSRRQRLLENIARLTSALQ